MALFLDDRSDVKRTTNEFFRALSLISIPGPADMPIIQTSINRVELELNNRVQELAKRGQKYDLFFFFISGNSTQEYSGRETRA